MTAGLAIATALSMVACAAAPGTAMAAPRPAAPSAPASPADPAFARAVATAPVVFEGDVVAVGPTPGVWSGRFVAYQAVTYRVTRIVVDADHQLSVGARLTVHHVLVAGSETADASPRLRPTLVHGGAAVIVLARWIGDRWAGLDEHHGVVVADAAHRAALTAR